MFRFFDRAFFDAAKRAIDANVRFAILITTLVALCWLWANATPQATSPAVLTFVVYACVIVGTYFFVSVSAFLLRDAFEPNPVESLVGSNLILSVSNALARIDEHAAAAFVRARQKANRFESIRRRAAADAQVPLAPSTELLIFPEDRPPRNLAFDLFEPTPDDIRRLEGYGPLNWRRILFGAPPPRTIEAANVREEFRRYLRGRFDEAVARVVREIAPSDFFNMIGGIFLLLVAAFFVVLMYPTPGHGLILSPKVAFSIWVDVLVIVDQLLKGLVLDVLEFFKIDIFVYEVDYSALAPVIVLLGLRMLPGSVALKVVSQYLQHGALRRLVARLTSENERALVERIEIELVRR